MGRVNLFLYAVLAPGEGLLEHEVPVEILLAPLTREEGAKVPHSAWGVHFLTRSRTAPQP